MFTATRFAVIGMSIALLGGVLVFSAVPSSGPATPGAESSGAQAPETILWRTGVVELTAAEFTLDVNDLTFNVGDARTDLSSDPGNRTYWTLEVVWFEHDVEQRLNMYFGSDGSDWWVDEIRTYDGDKRGEWVFAYGPFFQTPLGETFEGEVRVELIGTGRPDDRNNKVPAVLSFDEMRLTVSPNNRKPWPNRNAGPPAANKATESPEARRDTSPTWVTLELGGVPVVVEPVGEGVFEIIDDGAKHALKNVIDVTVTDDGRVWAATPRRIFQLGKGGALKAVDGGPKSIVAMDEGANGQLLVEAGEGGWLTSDGTTWNRALLEESAGAQGSALATDGSFWGFTGDGVGRLEGDVRTVYTPSEVFPKGYDAASSRGEQLDGGSTAVTPNGVVWAAASMAGSVSRFDGESWEEFRPLEGEAMQRVLDLASGDDGTVWALMVDGSDDYLARYDGSDWSTFRWDELVDATARFPDDIGAVSADGTVYLSVADDTGNHAIMAFDGESATMIPALREDGEEAFERLAVLANGGVLAVADRGLYVLMPDPKS